jgi:hypothetical protein
MPARTNTVTAFFEVTKSFIVSIPLLFRPLAGYPTQLAKSGTIEDKGYPLPLAVKRFTENKVCLRYSASARG